MDHDRGDVLGIASITGGNLTKKSLTGLRRRGRDRPYGGGRAQSTTAPTPPPPRSSVKDLSKTVTDVWHTVARSLAGDDGPDDSLPRRKRNASERTTLT